MNKEGGVVDRDISKVQELLSQLSLVTAVDNSTETANDDSSSISNHQEVIQKLIHEFQNTNKNITASTIFTTITPFLFSSDHVTANANANANANTNTHTYAINTITQPMALQTLIEFVSTNPNQYTLPAITSISNYVQQTIIGSSPSSSSYSSSSSFNICPNVLSTIVQQLQHPTMSISNHATQILSLLSTKLPPSPQQRFVTSSILLLLYHQVQQFVQIMTPESANVNVNASAKASTNANTSVLLIRNLSLMIDILLELNNSSSINNGSTSLSTSYLSPLSLEFMTTSSSASASTNTDNTDNKTTTILDPILDLLKFQHHQQHLKGGKGGKYYDPLLVMNIFELIEQMVMGISSSSTSGNNGGHDYHLLDDWIEEEMIDFLLSKVGFYFDTSSTTTTSSSTDVITDATSGATALVCSDDIDLFCFSSALTILSHCCCSGRTGTGTGTDTNTTKNTLTPQMMIRIFKHILHHCINESYDEVQKIHYIHSLTTFIQGGRFNNGHNHHHDNADERLKLILQEMDIIDFWFYLRQGKSEFKAVLLNSIAQVLSRKSSSNDDTNVDMDTTNDNVNANANANYNNNIQISDEVCMTMYNQIGIINSKLTSNTKSTTEILMEQTKSSIIEIRNATYEVYKAIIVHRKQNRGSFQLVNHVGFLEWMLSRSVDDMMNNKIGQELKYDIVKGILDSEMRGLLQESVVRLLQRYVDQGAFYVKGVGGDILLK